MVLGSTRSRLRLVMAWAGGGLQAAALWWLGCGASLVRRREQEKGSGSGSVRRERSGERERVSGERVKRNGGKNHIYKKTQNRARVFHFLNFPKASSRALCVNIDVESMPCFTYSSTRSQAQPPSMERDFDPTSGLALFTLILRNKRQK